MALQPILAADTGAQAATKILANDTENQTNIGLKLDKTAVVVTLGKNLFNYAAVTEGSYVGSGFTVLTAAGFSVSPIIPVLPSTQYVFSGLPGSTTVMFLDASQVALGTGIAGAVNNTPWTTSASARFVRFTTKSTFWTPNSNYTAYQLEQAAAATAYAPYSNNVTSIAGNPVTAAALIDGLLYVHVPTLPGDVVNKLALDNGLALKVNNTDLFNYRNIFDLSKVTEGNYVNSTSFLVAAAAGWSISDHIPVLPSTTYILSGIGQLTDLMYEDAAKTPLGTGVASLGVGASFTTSAAARFVRFTTKKSFWTPVPDYTTYQLELGSIATAYIGYGVGVIKPALIPAVTVAKKFSVVTTALSVAVRSSMDSTYDAWVIMRNDGYVNGLYSPVSAKLLLKTDSDGATGQTLPGAGNDDAGPSFFNHGIYGGDHARVITTITATAHGKTLADVGAIYKDFNNRNFTIFKVVDANTIIVGAINTATLPDWAFPVPVGPLTYVSNGTNNGVITIGSQLEGAQLYPSIKNRVQQTYVDGVAVGVGSFTGDVVSITESYDIIDTVDMQTKLTANRPGGGYTVQPDFTNGDAIITVYNNFVFKEGVGWIVLSGWINRKDIVLDRFFGISQSGLVVPSWATTFKRYFPAVLPFTNNSRSWDFRTREEFNTANISTYLPFDNTLWESGNATKRVVDIFQSAGLNVNFNMGYLPIGGVRENMVNIAWEMTNSKKLYPRYIDNKIAGTGSVLPANTYIQGAVFRGWSRPSGLRTNMYLTENGGIYYLFLDYHAIGQDTIQLPQKLQGKTITVLEKSANVQVPSVVVGDLEIFVTTNTPMYGYCNLQIN